MEKFTVLCTYCMDSPQPAIKTCLHCESSLCHKHLEVHSKSNEHKVIEPIASLEDHKCSVHKKNLTIYCYDDEKCICLDCCLEEHEEHKIKLIDEASEEKRGKLRKLLNVLASREDKINDHIWSFQANIRKQHEKALDLANKTTTIFRNIRRQLEVLEKSVLTEVFKGDEEFSLQVSTMIKPLEAKKDELSRTIKHIEELCNKTDSTTLLQYQKSKRDDFCVPEEWDNLNSCRNQLPKARDLDEGMILETIHSGLCEISSNFSKMISVHEASGIFLDVNTAAANIAVSQDMKMVLLSKTYQEYPDSLERFEDGQIISRGSFSSGWQYWEMETSEMGDWMMGMAYASIDRRGDRLWLGENTKSWCLSRYQNQYSVIHNGQEKFIPHQCLNRRFRIYLDYGAGRLSFYELGDTIRHLHTFTTVFTEPVYVAFGVLQGNDKCWLRIRS